MAACHRSAEGMDRADQRPRVKGPRADRPKGFGSALSSEADIWQAAMSENQSQILL